MSGRGRARAQARARARVRVRTREEIRRFLAIGPVQVAELDLKPGGDGARAGTGLISDPDPAARR